MVYGRPPPLLISFGNRKTPNNSAEQLLQERNLIINALKENLVIAQNRMKKQAYLHRRELNFQVGDEVFFQIKTISLALFGYEALREVSSEVLRSL